MITSRVDFELSPEELEEQNARNLPRVVTGRYIGENR